MPTTDDKLKLAQALFGGGGKQTNNSTYSTSTQDLSYRTATAKTDSANGKCTVLFDGDEATDGIEIPSTVAVKKGQIVNCLVVNGTPTIIGVIGWGDKVEQEIAESGGDNHFFTFTEEEKPGHSGAYVSTVEKQDWTPDADYTKLTSDAFTIHRNNKVQSIFTDSYAQIGTDDQSNLKISANQLLFKNGEDDRILDIQAYPYGTSLTCKDRLTLGHYSDSVDVPQEIDIYTGGEQLYINTQSGDIKITTEHPMSGETGNANIDRRGVKRLYIQDTDAEAYVPLVYNAITPVYSGTLNIDDPYNSNEICPIEAMSQSRVKLRAKGIYRISFFIVAGANAGALGAFRPRLYVDDVIKCDMNYRFFDSNWNTFFGQGIVKSNGESILQWSYGCSSTNASMRTFGSQTMLQIEYIGSWS